MKIVNPYFLLDLLGPITGRGDEEEEVEKYKYMDSSNETHYKTIINELFVDYYLSMTKQNKNTIRRTILETFLYGYGKRCLMEKVMR
ncbi:hypothetical protein D3C87_1089000 [compost metagenome]